MKINDKVLRYITFYIKAGDANLTPPIGPMLGQFPMDVRNFCNNFNNETKNYDKGVLLKVILTLYKDSSFIYEIKSPPLFFLLELASKNLKLRYKYKNIKYLFLHDLYIIALIKNKDYNLINFKIFFKKILKEAKKNGYKIIDFIKNDIYYFYI